MWTQRLKCQPQGLQCSLSSPLPLCYNCYLGIFVKILTVGVGISLSILPALGTFLFSPIGLPSPALMRGLFPCLIFCAI